jgi:MerR family transcriptional regulator, copper efflux regulator
MTAFTIQDVSRRSGLSEPTLRYYEEVGLIGPVDRDARSGHRRYSGEDVDTLQMLACLRAMGMGHRGYAHVPGQPGARTCGRGRTA